MYWTSRFLKVKVVLADTVALPSTSPNAGEEGRRFVVWQAELGGKGFPLCDSGLCNREHLPNFPPN